MCVGQDFYSKKSIFLSMSMLRITVLRVLQSSDIFKEFPVKPRDWMERPCEVFEEGQEFILDKLSMPDGFCEAAWYTIYPRVRAILFGGDNPFFEEKGTAVTCCFDGLRPVIFKFERIE
jgi:uncharacterized repeat protein (TIGR04076 family)